MSDNNEEFFKGGISELSSSLKENFNSNFDDLGKSLKSGFDEIKENMTKDQKKEADSITDFVEHLNSCSNDNCEIHKAKNTFGNQMYMKGFLLGAKFGKKKRS